MADPTYDLIVVGGGLGGASLAAGIAAAGGRVLVVERETRFRDRVRGEQMHPWGVTTARALGVYEPILAACGQQTRWWSLYVGGTRFANRDLAATTPHGVGSFNFAHPAMQETLLAGAAAAGATVWRGATVVDVTPGDPPRVDVDRDGERVVLEARIVVGADGRDSRVRAWAGFTTRRDPDHLVTAGVLLAGVAAPADATHLLVGPAGASLLAPLRNGRARVYVVRTTAGGPRPLSGAERIGTFVECCRNIGVPAEWLANATPDGPSPSSTARIAGSITPRATASR